jgi:hypothetical protein
MAVITQRDIAELQLCGHAHLIASRTTAHRPALIATAAVSRAASVIRRIDQWTGWAGCGDAGPWLCE